MSLCRNFLIFVIFSFHCVSIAIAEQKSTTSNTSDSEIVSMLKMQAVFAAESWAASKEPRAIGALEMLVSPVFIADSNSFLESCAISCAYFTIGLYNFLLDENKKTEDTIFIENFIAWNVFMALYTLSKHSASPPLKMTDQEKGRFYLSMDKDSVALNYRFGF